MLSDAILFAFLTLMGVALGVTKRTAFIAVQNNTPQRIMGVSLVHKYSDIYKNQFNWRTIAPYQLSPDPFKVEYNTGAFTAGRDWWLLTFYSEDMKTLYYTDPDNLRSFVDSLENHSSGIISAMAAAAGAVMAAVGASLVGTVAGAAEAVSTAEPTTDSPFNSTSKTGFKQHTLRAEDANHLTEIVINPDCSVTFKSRSGDSTTGISKRPAPGWA